MNDIGKRELGQRSLLALEAIEVATWHRSVATMAAAEVAYQQGELTPARAYELLVALLEQRALLAQLEGQVAEGLRAGKRILERDLKVAAETEKAERARVLGQNRFGIRSRVPRVDTPAG